MKYKAPVTARARLRSTSAAATRALGVRLAKALRTGDVVLLRAPLGAGKTTLVQGVARALGARVEALSPTFVVAETLDARVPIHHLDFYRLNQKEILAMGLQDYLTGEGAIAPGVVLIEWPDRCRPLWPTERLDIRIEHGRTSEERTIELVGRGAKWAAWVGHRKTGARA